MTGTEDIFLIPKKAYKAEGARVEVKRRRVVPNTVKICVMGEPVPKARARAGQNGFYTPKRSKIYEELVGYTAKGRMDGRKPFEVPLKVTIDASLPIPSSWSKKAKGAALDGSMKPSKKPDLDNLVKSALDGLNGIVFKDDSQVVSLEAHKKFAAIPCLDIYVEPVDGGLV